MATCSWYSSSTIGSSGTEVRSPDLTAAWCSQHACQRDATSLKYQNSPQCLPDPGVACPISGALPCSTAQSYLAGTRRPLSSIRYSESRLYGSMPTCCITGWC
eukprot:5082186-Prymnesium_polylepis.1